MRAQILSKILLLSLVFFFYSLPKELTFADYFKPLKLDYLYNLLDEHQEEKKKLDKMFKVKKIYNLNKVKGKKVVSYSLFCKSDFTWDKQPSVKKGTIYKKSAAYGHKAQPFYTSYVQPLINQLRELKTLFPGWVARIYLAHDLEFLVPSLVRPNVEIFLMASNSIAAAPGAMWRFLVFDDPEVSVAYVKDADLALPRFGGDARTIQHMLEWVALKDSKGFFRLRDLGLPMVKMIRRIKRYSPIAACCFGAKNVHWVNMEKAMKGFILHRTLFPNESRNPLDISVPRHPYGYGNEFPSYGFDERFLTHVIYFEAADRDELTLIPTDHLLNNKGRNLPHNNWIKLDLRYTNYKAFNKYYGWQ